jgi:hypothetical protein
MAGSIRTSRQSDFTEAYTREIALRFEAAFANKFADASAEKVV